MSDSPKAVILLSGGLDSATVLAIAKSRGFDCYTIGFDYGQKHNSELNAAHRVTEALGDHAHKVIQLDLGSIGGSALTSNEISVPVGRGSRLWYSCDLCSRAQHSISVNRPWLW